MLPAYYVSQTITRVDDTSAYMPDEIFCRMMAASYVGNAIWRRPHKPRTYASNVP